MKKLIFSLFMLTIAMGCQNENDGTKNSSTSNDKSLEENQAKILKEREENRIKDSLKSVEDEKKEIESYSGNYCVPPPTGPGTGVCTVCIEIKNGFIIAEQECGGHNEHGRTSETETLFKVKLELNKKFKLSNLFDVSGGHAFGCDYIEFKNNKLYLYDEKMKVVNDDFCGFFVKKCDCIISKSK